MILVYRERKKLNNGRKFENGELNGRKTDRDIGLMVESDRIK